ncbi:hypothetical protein TELCIR_09183 [Teladorsagia circumcincta]|uniref:CDR ABC transporter domain-containing protein n=1 Tax=Teladorsagia circumcincta TaxID=45464 RepID=A0A2G9UGZ7_TELCI|nr:hypothetical protein TELCIR_09183 [Teladorsagia circumcincta]
MAFGGYFINQGSLPFYFYPFKHLSYFGYAFESLTVNEWSHVDSIAGCERPGALGCYRNGSDVIRSLSFSPQNKWLNAMLILVMILAFRSIAFVSLLMRARLRK